MRGQDSASGSQLLDVQIRVALVEKVNSDPQPDKDEREGDVDMDEPQERPSPPVREVNVVIYTPSKTWVPPDGATTSASAAMKDEDDKTSVFSMTDYGALDWDHSGDESEYERAPVTPKPKRRASSAYPTRRKSFLDADHALPASKRRPRAKSCPAPVARRKLQLRDARGRFTRAGSLASVALVTPVKAKPPRRASSSSSERLPQRDSKGRFARTPSKPGSATILVVEVPQAQLDVVQTKTSKEKRPSAKSPYFPAPISPPKTPNPNPEDPDSPAKANPSKRPPGLVSCIPFPPLSSPHFGLIQEKLAHDPLRLLIAITFLIRTHGKHAIPVFYELIEKYPTPESLIVADKVDIVSIIRHLGLQNSRAATYQTYAKIWLEDPPMKGKRYAVRDYPEKGSGKDILRGEVIADDDLREAWEIGHMTSGPYALDSWRIFCRDILRGVATGWNGEGAKEEGFQPEWMRVLPEDKELRAYLRWMWLKEGFEWDPFTGEKDVASPELMRAAMEGRIGWDDKGGMQILDEVMPESAAEKVQGGLGMDSKVEIPESDVHDD